ncbi:MAG: sigma 54-interacting transcriptional regulator [Planctomycetota bacterium]
MHFFVEMQIGGKISPPIPLQSGRTLVGRHPDCDLVVPDPHASRQQLAIEVEGDACHLRDVGSKNPVTINDEVVKEAELQPGDRIQVGETVLTLRRGMIDMTGDTHLAVSVVDEGPSAGAHRVTVAADSVVGGLASREPDASTEGRLDVIYHLAESMAAAPDLDRFFDQVLDRLFDSLPVSRGFIGMGLPEKGTFQAVKVKSRGETGECTIQMSQTILDEIQLERKALLVQDAPGELAHGGAKSIIRLGIQAFLCAPMFVGDDYLGLLYFDQLTGASPFSEADLTFVQGVARLTALTVDNLRFREQLREENRSLRAILERRNQLIARSPVMLEVLRKVQRIAERDSSVLIQGETGTGKELVARAIHDQSPRRDGPFVAFNCSLSNPSLIESELFGHVKGAFTDASRDHKGKFELASGGTLFLDEIGDMPLETQVKILRAIQEKSIEPVGGERSIAVDLRLISATHRDLQVMRNEKQFREDLYYRLAVLTLALPPLRDRGEDILEIGLSFLNGADEGTFSFDKSAQKAMLAYNWPGNVRELQNAMEQASFNASDTKIRAKDLPSEMSQKGSRPRLQVPLASIPELEAKHIRKVLRSCDGNKKRAAEILGISRETLYQKLKLYEIPK